MRNTELAGGTGTSSFEYEVLGLGQLLAFLSGMEGLTALVAEAHPAIGTLGVSILAYRALFHWQATILIRAVHGPVHSGKDFMLLKPVHLLGSELESTITRADVLGGNNLSAARVGAAEGKAA